MDVTRRHFGALSLVMDVPVLGGACSTDEHVLATPPGLTHAAIEPKRARANAMAEHVLPVSARAAGLLDNTRLGKGLEPYALEAIQAPTLAISARHDAFGTFACTQCTASRVPRAGFIGHEQGGHLLMGHDEDARAAILEWIHASAGR